MMKETHHFKAVGWVLEYAEFEEFFITFLCKEGIYFQYMYNINHFPNVANTIFGVFDQIRLRSNIYRKNDFINLSICYDQTEEGKDYWKSMNEKFKKEYNEKYKC